MHEDHVEKDLLAVPDSQRQKAKQSKPLSELLLILANVRVPNWHRRAQIMANGTLKAIMPS